MSIDFAAEFKSSDIVGWQLVHAGGDDRPAGSVHEIRDVCVGELVEHKIVCAEEDCQIYGPSVVPVLAVEAPSLNVANGNARFLAEYLGLDCDEMFSYGLALEAQDFRDRVVTAISLAEPDEGVPAHDVSPLSADAAANDGEGATMLRSARMIDCGRPAGYLQRQLAELLTIADWALAIDRQVCVG